MRHTMIGLLGGLLMICTVTAQPPATQPPSTPFRGRGFVPPGAAAPARAEAAGRGEAPQRADAGRLEAPLLREFAPLPESAATGKLLFLEVLVADVTGEFEHPTAAKILEMEREGRLSGTSRIRLTSLESQPAFVQFGERAPRVTGSTVTPRGTTPIYADVNVGTLVQASTRMESDGTALIQIHFQKSSVSKPSQEADRLEPQPVVMVTAQSAVRAKPGEPVLISTGPSSTPSTSQTWIVLTLRVL